MDLIVRAFPVIPGMEQRAREMARELQTTRIAEANEFYSRYGIARETWHLQTTPSGTWIIGVTQVGGEVRIDQAADRYSRSEEPFDRWFKDQVHDICGINPDEQPLGPPTECVFDSRDLADMARLYADS